MTLIKKHAKTACLTDTSVENIFINDYMVSAPGDYVKIYLLTLMYTDLDRQASRDDIAKTLNVKPKLLERKKVVPRVLDKIMTFVDRFYNL